MPDNSRNRNWLDSEEQESSAAGLPRPDLNPLVNPLLGQNMGRWAEVYFTSPPDQREHAVEKLVEELQAKSGAKKPAISNVAPAVNREVSPAGKITNSVPDNALDPEGEEFDAPELPLPVFGKFKPGSLPVEIPRMLQNDVVVCRRCSADNAVEQRFCGRCGATLAPESPEPEPVPTKTEPVREQPSRHQNADSDWEWLRERTLSGYEIQEKSGRRSRVLLPIAFFLILGIAGYIFLRGRSSSTQQPTATSGSAEKQSNASINIPVPPTPSHATEHTEAAPREKESSSPSEVRPAPLQDSSTSSNQSSASSDDGRDELAQAQRYLAGEGVPKNSWMASQFLWKSVAKQNEGAVLLLSDLYARGDGVSRSCEQARVLLVSAAKKGSSAAAQRLRSVESTCR